VSSPGASPPDIGVVVVAAGAGVRAGPGEPKQFRAILGVPMLLRALRPFTSHPEVRQVIIVLPSGYADRPPEWLGKIRGDSLGLVAGGAQRIDSVRAGLQALAPDAAVILVHDAARPFVSRGTIDAVIARARAGVGAVAAVPASDTLKEVGQGRHRPTPRITRTVDRERIWRAQTPQGFPRQMLLDAYAQLAASTENGGMGAPSDDAEVCERAGFPVELIPDSPYNVKITTADDFRIAEALARELR
jgi:2-C-methyl-D-erythritol 4-phosphate cytidylyltransferase